ncbi:MAG TPA: DUF3465 domain-containing protein [Woeseiaceae bacterium]|nr:DUF3465 domain-containing protein [Woeseiaceae bacterium]
MSARIYGKRDDDEWIVDEGIVVRLIPDDVHDSRHQRFILRLRGGQTLLIAHNLALSPRVPIGLGDRVRFRGVYEWSDAGGLVHWTHADPMANPLADPVDAEPGGYVEFRGQRYR